VLPPFLFQRTRVPCGDSHNPNYGFPSGAIPSQARRMALYAECPRTVDAPHPGNAEKEYE